MGQGGAAGNFVLTCRSGGAALTTQQTLTQTSSANSAIQGSTVANLALTVIDPNVTWGGWTTQRQTYNPSTGEWVYYRSVDNGATWIQSGSGTVTPPVLRTDVDDAVMRLGRAENSGGNAQGYAIAWFEIRDLANGTVLGRMDAETIWSGRGDTFADAQGGVWRILPGSSLNTANSASPVYTNEGSGKGFFRLNQGMMSQHMEMVSTSFVHVPMWARWADIFVQGGGGGGGGAGAANNATMIQSGGAGGGMAVPTIITGFPVTPLHLWTCTVGAGATGGAGGTGSGHGVVGNNGGSSSISGATPDTFILLSNGGSGGGRSLAASTAIANGGLPSAQATTPFDVGRGFLGIGAGSSAGTGTTGNVNYLVFYGAGGSSGAPASNTTLGGNGGNAAQLPPASTGFIAAGSGNTGTINGGHGANATHFGSGGGGGGGGALAGTGGSGGAGGPGIIRITFYGWW
jgi:hypothetical protein